jgi:hypothetical protein
MKRCTIENAIEIINYAIKYQISVKEASVRCGFANTYVKNVKRGVARFEKNNDLHHLFDDAYQKYIQSNKKDTSKFNINNTKMSNNDIVKLLNQKRIPTELQLPKFPESTK